MILPVIISMKKSLITLFILLLTIPVSAQRNQASRVLDRTVAAFHKAGGVKAVFTLQIFEKQALSGYTEGTLLLKGEKFVLRTDNVVTWFDGKTQWSYLTDSDEVNISSPGPDELQEINPYAVLNNYKTGYDYAMGTVKTYRGKSVNHVILTSTDPKKQISRIELYIAEGNYPVFIIAENRNNSRSEVSIISYQTNQAYADRVFVFDSKEYPTAEIIDLR